MRHRHGLITLLTAGALMLAGGVTSADAAVPSNDTFAGATVIGALPFTASQDTTEAPFGTADDLAAGTACGISPGTFTFSNSVWYAYTPAADQAVRIDTSSSSYSAAAAVLTGTPSSFTSAGCFLTSSTLSLTAGTTYYIDLLQSPAGFGGTLQFSVIEQAAPNPILTVDRSGTFSKAGTATVRGTASCTTGSFAFLDGSLTQSVGRIATISGFGFSQDQVVCDGTAHPWSFVVTPPSGLFRGGKAQASVFLEACNAFLCDSKQVTETINLNGKG